MAILTKKISQLESVTETSSTDVMEISKDLKNGSYSSRKIKISDLTKSKVNDITSNTYIPLKKKFTDTIYQLTQDDDYIRVAATSKGSYNLILPLATSSGKLYIIKNVGQRNNKNNIDITISTSGSDVIELQLTSVKLRFGECLQIIDGGMGSWDVISRA